MSSKSMIAAVVLGSALLGAAPSPGADGPFAYFPLTPCRIVDTRYSNQSVGGYGPGLVSDDPRSFPIQGNCLVPSGAKAVTINVTVVKPAAQTSLSQGYLTVYPTGIATPLVSTINFPQGTPALANGAIAPLADQSLHPSDLTVKAKLVSGGKVDVIIDVTGYFDIP